MKWILCGLASAVFAPTGSADTVVYNPKSARPIALKVGDVFLVQEAALPGAGYSWQPNRDGRPGLKFVSTAMVPLKSGAVGGQQSQTMTFLAVTAGVQQLQLQYGRPWELAKGTKPERIVTVTLTVK